MKLNKACKKVGVIAAMSAAITLTVPMIAPASPTTVVSAATMKLNKTKLSMLTGETETLKVSGAKSVKWSSSNKNVATVNSKGEVTAVFSGTATITAKAGKKTYKCKVTVAAFKGEKLELENGVTLMIPKGWKVTDVNQNGTTMKVLQQNAKANSRIIITVVKVPDKMTKEQFTQSIKSLLNKDTQKTAVTTQLGLNVEVESFNQEEFEEDGAVCIATLMKFSSEKELFLDTISYDVFDGSYIYEVTGNDFYDTDVNYNDYVSYIISSVE